jgi:hypothetical protein
MVFAAAGRRIDAPGADLPSFPLSNVELVTQRVRSFLHDQRAKLIVTSAACGTDLILLDEAGRLGIRRRVILPFDRDRFRATSVTDRPGDWGPLYDRLINEITSANDVLVSTEGAGELAAYTAANNLILEEAQALARQAGECASAVLVWDAHPRGAADFTQAFGERARERGMDVFCINTLA